MLRFLNVSFVFRSYSLFLSLFYIFGPLYAHVQFYLAPPSSFCLMQASQNYRFIFALCMSSDSRVTASLRLLRHPLTAQWHIGEKLFAYSGRYRSGLSPDSIFVPYYRHMENIKVIFINAANNLYSYSCLRIKLYSADGFSFLLLFNSCSSIFFFRLSLTFFTPAFSKNLGHGPKRSFKYHGHIKSAFVGIWPSSSAVLRTN